MYKDDYDNRNDRNADDVYSRPVRAGKRTYFFDVKATKGNDYYLTITESKKKVEADGRFSFDKHKIFLYKEDFDKFAEGLQEVVDFIRNNCLKGSPAGEGNYTSKVEFEDL
ncbi:MAG: PUR family DNA/RNA-binding protein [Bacteroidales bacterium]|nr:PUR family DNA/RNA-binding protein [Bacteroidales bacterium]